MLDNIPQFFVNHLQYGLTHFLEIPQGKEADEMKKILVFLCMFVLVSVGVNAVDLAIDCDGRNINLVDKTAECAEGSVVGISYYISNVTEEDRMDAFATRTMYDNSLLEYMGTGASRNDFMESNGALSLAVGIEINETTFDNAIAIRGNCVALGNCPIGEGNSMSVAFLCKKTGTVYCNGKSVGVIDTRQIVNPRSKNNTYTWWMKEDAEFGGKSQLFGSVVQYNPMVASVPMPLTININLLEIDTSKIVTIYYTSSDGYNLIQKSMNTQDDLTVDGPIYYWGIWEPTQKPLLYFNVAIIQGTEIIISVEGYENLSITGISGNTNPANAEDFNLIPLIKQAETPIVIEEYNLIFRYMGREQSFSENNAMSINVDGDEITIDFNKKWSFRDLIQKLQKLFYR